MGLRGLAGISFERALPKRDGSFYVNVSQTVGCELRYMEPLLKSRALWYPELLGRPSVHPERHLWHPSLLSLHLGFSVLASAAPGDDSDQSVLVAFLKRICPYVSLLFFLSRERR